MPRVLTTGVTVLLAAALTTALAAQADRSRPSQPNATACSDTSGISHASRNPSPVSTTTYVSSDKPSDNRNGNGYPANDAVR